MVVVRVVHSITPDHKSEYIVQWKDLFFGFGFEKFSSLEELKEELADDIYGYDVDKMHIEEREYGWQGNIISFIREMHTEVEHVKYAIPCEHCGGVKYTSTGFRGTKNIEYKCDNCGKKLYIPKATIEQWWCDVI